MRVAWSFVSWKRLCVKTIAAFWFLSFVNFRYTVNFHGPR